MSSSGEEEDTGPSVDSSNAEERIEARRIRIKKRIEAKRRAEMGEDLDKKKEVKEELSKSRKQMEDSRLRVTKLEDDGLELVTNIRVAGDEREAQRRVDEDNIRRRRKEKLDAENKNGSERFEEITRKWESALQKEIPQDLLEMLKSQKKACDDMIDEKNKLINEFQSDLKQKDDQYVKDRKKQAEDIDLMIERMDEQVKSLSKACRDELGQIEKAFVAERTELKDTHMKKWTTMMQQRGDKEVDFMKHREKRVEDYEQQLQHLRVQDAEEYNMVKIKLETDVQILQQQLQQMKATYQLNQEKLEYNFQVLRKRDEENTITKSQQKRKITRLQDILTNLKNKLMKQEKMYKEDNTQLTEDYKRITEQFKELQKKSKHFMATDAKKFHDVWVMNEEEAKELVSKVLEQDRIVHEHQLGLGWTSPDIAFMDNTGPIPSEATKRKSVSAQQVVQEVLSSAGGAGQGGLGAGTDAGTTEAGGTQMTTDLMSEQAESRRSMILQKFSPKLIKSILELLCDESGFLIEQKLNTLLSPLERDEHSLMKLDAIFSALGVDTEEDVQQLVTYFVAANEGGSMSATSGSVAHKTSISGGARDASDQGPLSVREDDEDFDGEIERVTGGPDTDDFDTPRSDRAQQDRINANDVLKALKLFVEDNKQAPREKKAAQFQIASLGDRDDTDDEKYWQSFPGVLSDNSERVWDALLDGVEKYHETLTSRTTLIDETDSLRQQNAELRMLLHQYVNSKVNNELEIPPTRVLQLELNPPQ